MPTPPDQSEDAPALDALDELSPEWLTAALTHARVLELTFDGRGLVGEDLLMTLSDPDKLLFDRRMDAVAVVSVSPELQRERVLARGTMTEAQFEAILAKQMPDAEKRARADYVIVTDTLDHARAQVRNVVADIRRKSADA